MNKVVAIGNDHAGVALKMALLPEIDACGFSALDLGCNSSEAVDYPDYGKSVAMAVTTGRAAYGIAICGSGIGIAIAANRINGARAAQVMNSEMAALARQHNDANILVLGARFIETDEAKDCVRSFLTTSFEGGRHTARVEKLEHI